MSKIWKISILIFVAFILTGFYLYLNNLKTKKRATASSNSDIVTTFDDWNLGTKENLDITGGVASIDNVSEAHYPISSCTTNGVGNASDITDGNQATYVTLNNSDNPPNIDWGIRSGDYFTCDLDESLLYNKLRIYTAEDQTNLDQGVIDYMDENDVWHENIVAFGNSNFWTEYTFSPAVKIKQIRGTNKTPINEPTGYIQLAEVQMYSTGFATHTTGASQIDGGENFWEWEANTIVQTVPANTSATYQYRTSANGSDWTAWVGNIGSVTNRTGDDSDNPTRYRYLQIKATLTNTDGASTPTIDSYTIDYHTNQKPTTPTAQTAVVQ